MKFDLRALMCAAFVFQCARALEFSRFASVIVFMVGSFRWPAFAGDW
jgi:hypothetical protein